MASDTRMNVPSLDLLTFIALSSGVHADAVQCQVDDTRRAIMQMSSDEDALVELEAQLRTVLKKQARLHTLHNAIAHSQAQRHHGEETHRSRHATADRTGPRAQRMSIRHLARSQATTTTRAGRGEQTEEASVGASSSRSSSAHVQSLGAAEVVRLSSRALCADEIRASRPPSVTDDPSTPTDVAAVDAETDALKEALRQLETRSLKAKLLRLEAHKKATAAVDARSILARHVTPFRFSPTVEQLWGRTSGVISPDPQSKTGGSASPSVCGSPSKSGVSRRPSVASAATDVLEGRPPVINSATLPGVVHRACQRLVGRYADALDALGSTNLSEDSDPQQVFDCLLYACALDPESADASALDADTATWKEADALSSKQEVEALMDLDEFVRHFRGDSTLFGTAVVAYDNKRFATASGNTECRAAASPSANTASVLSMQEFCALPVDWPSTRALADVPTSALLAPARHLLTPRFSFSDAREMKCLDTLRLRVQQAIVRTAVDLDAICEDVARAAPGLVAARDLAALRARLAATRDAQRADDSRQWGRWQTLIREASS